MAKRRKTIRTKPRKTPRDALEWQERHSPTVEISVDDPEATRKARRNLTRCRQSEVWRHNRLTGMQREAERDELTEGEMGPARDAETDDDALREAETLREPDTLAPKVGDRGAEGKRDAEPLRLAVGDSPAWHCT